MLAHGSIWVSEMMMPMLQGMGERKREGGYMGPAVLVVTLYVI